MFFYTLDDWQGDEYTSTGLEAQYDRNQFSIEAAVGNYDGIDGSYDFGNGFSALGNAVSMNGDFEVGIVG